MNWDSVVSPQSGVNENVQQRLELFGHAKSSSIDLSSICGVVHSVYEQVCYITCVGEVRLILLTPSIGTLPGGLIVATPPGFRFRSHLTVGAPVNRYEDRLNVGANFCVVLRRLESWSDRMPTLRIADTDTTALSARCSAWLSAFQTAQTGEINSRRPATIRAKIDDIESKLSSSALLLDLNDIALRQLPTSQSGSGQRWIPLAPLLSLNEGVCDQKLAQASQTLRQIVGAGPGLTPAGDDFVVGYLAGLHCGKHWKRQAWRQAMADVVRDLARRTTSISRHYLLHAALGHASEPLLRLAKQIVQGNGSERVGAATLNAMAVGSTSGRAGVFGLLVGMAAWQPLEFEQTVTGV